MRQGLSNVALICLEHVIVVQEGLTHGAISLYLPLEHWRDRHVPALCVVGDGLYV